MSKRVRSHHKARKHSRKHLSRKHLSRKHSRKYLSKKHVRKQRKRRVSKRTRKMRGGFGPAPACPLVSPAWNPVSGGNYFKLGTPIGVGGLSPYFAENNTPSPQHPYRRMGGGSGKGWRCAGCDGSSKGMGTPSTYPWIPQPLVNAYRVAQSGLGNSVLQYQGLAPNPDPRPEIQQQMQS